MVEIAKYEDYEELILEMNKSFQVDFEKILPKLYFKDNPNMVHFITRVDNKIVSSVGLYEVKRISPYSTLKVGIVGAVSTLPEYRTKGYMSNEINALIDYAKNNNYDLLMLGGDRIRYSHFGFEYAGKKYVASITKRSKYLLNPENYVIKEASKDDYDYILRMYKRQKQYIERDKKILDRILASWESKTYIVKVNDKNIGYYCLSKDGNSIIEIVYDKQYLDTMLIACLQDKEYIRIELSNENINEELLSKIHDLNVSIDYSYKILNLDNVMEYMNIDSKYKSRLENMENSKMIREVFGDNIKESKYSNLRFIHTSEIDHG